MNWYTKLQSLSETDAWLADVAIQSTALLAFVLLAGFAMRRSSASRRHALLLAAAGSLPLLFVVSQVLPEWRVLGADPPAVQPIKVVFEEKIITGEPVAPVAAAAVVRTEVAGVQTTAASEPGSPWFVVWLVGVGFLWLKLGLGVLSLLRVSRRGGQFSDQEVLNVFAEEVRAMRIARAPQLLKLEQCAMPMTWGLLQRHVVALPSDANGWDTDRLRRVIRHELAHVARRDCATGWLATACLALLWFVPLTWLVRSALVRAREAACDDLALREAGSDERDAYACDLIDIIGKYSRSKTCPGMAIAFAMGARRSRFIKQRLAAILDADRNRRGLNLRLLLVSVPIWLALVLAVGTVATLRPTAHAGPDAGSISKDGPPVTQTYTLVTSQIANLIPGGVTGGRQTDDPFSVNSSGSQVVNFDLESGAADARSSLVTRFGIPIGSGDPVELEFESRYKLRVKAPAGIQEAIAKVLDGMLGGNQIQLRMYVFEIEDPAWLAKQLGSAKFASSSAGIIGQEQFDQLRAAIEKREEGKGKQRNMMPAVVTKSGLRAKVELIKEFIYPTEYDPPEIPANFKPEEHDGGSVPVTPANPTAFDIRNVGLTWEVEPYLRADGSVGMDLAIEDVQFLGYINYGSPINAAVKGLLKQRQVTLTDNKILQPIFKAARISTEFVVPAGKLVAINGFANEEPEAAIGAAIDKGATEDWAKKNTNVKLAKHQNRLFVIEAKVLTGE